MDDEDDEALPERIAKVYKDFIIPAEPGRMLYALEAISSIVAPTRLTNQACDDATDLVTALLDTDLIKNLTNEILNKPHIVPLNKCSSGDRHAIFERILQIIRSVFTGRNSFLKMQRNEIRVRDEMKKTCERMIQSRQTPRPIDPNMDYALIKQQIMPPPIGENTNNATESTKNSVLQFKS